MIGLGPENYFRDPWNKLDFSLITIGFLLQITPKAYVPNNSYVLFKMTRIFRITTLFKLLTKTKSVTLKSDVYLKSKRLISQMAIIIPIVLKFFPLYIISYYALGVIGMDIFRKDTSDQDASPYAEYN